MQSTTTYRTPQAKRSGDPSSLASGSLTPRSTDWPLRLAALPTLLLVLGALGASSGCSTGRSPYMMMAPATAPERQPAHDTEAYARIDENPFLPVASSPLSTFSVDVDTASYSNVRRFLNDDRLPPRDAVRIEELINYFRYDYPQPAAERPFSVTTEAALCPWNPEHQLVRIGLQGRSMDSRQLPPRNLVFLLDVSGSMGSPDKLPLLKSAMRLLVEGLTASDRVAIVVYAGASGLVLESTPGDQKVKILAALDELQAGGSTNGGQGIQLAYAVAREHLSPQGINRVILATDGDFNVGISSEGELTRLIERERESGVALTVLGLGTGNLKDSTMEALADRGNGNYAYIDSLAEARKVLVTEAGATLLTIAKDVKIQVEFNPRRVRSYRLIGYENRLLRNEDFADDSKDAGEIGAGHSVTALYEIVPLGAPPQTAQPSQGAELRYQSERTPTLQADSAELMTLKLRYKAPQGAQSHLISHVVEDPGAHPGAGSPDLRFASAVAAFGMLLRESAHRGRADFPLVQELAAEGARSDPHGFRQEFLDLVNRAARLKQD